jgi:hypothetical protein
MQGFLLFDPRRRGSYPASPDRASMDGRITRPARPEARSGEPRAEGSLAHYQEISCLAFLRLLHELRVATWRSCVSSASYRRSSANYRRMSADYRRISANHFWRSEKNSRTPKNPCRKPGARKRGAVSVRRTIAPPSRLPPALFNLPFSFFIFFVPSFAFFAPFLCPVAAGSGRIRLNVH